MEEVIGAGWVTLRIWQPEDRGALAQIRVRSRREFDDWLPGASRDLADIPAFLNYVAAAYRDGTAFFYAIVECGEPVGQCSLHHRDEGMAELGYWVRTDRTGHGLAPAAVAAVTRAAFDAGVVKLVIHCDEGNERSAAVARKAGFVHHSTVELDPALPRSPTQTGREMTWVRLSAIGEGTSLARSPNIGQERPDIAPRT